METGNPFTLIGRYYRNLDTNYVVCDDVNGSYLAAEHLIHKRHKNIAFLNGPKYISSAKERLTGFKKAFEDNKIEYNENNVFNIAIKMGAGEKRIKEILKKSKDYTAVVCFSDMIAWETAYTLKNMGISVPGDVSIVGFDNRPVR